MAKVRLMLVAALGCLVSQQPAVAGSTGANALAPIRGFVALTNAGKMKQAASQFAPNATMTDEFAPYYWTGPHVFDQWLAAYGKLAKAKGMTDPIMTLSKPAVFEAEGNEAYVVIPAKFTFKHDGAVQEQTGKMTFALARRVGNWRIESFTWSLSSGR